MVWTRLGDGVPDGSRRPAVQVVPHSLTVCAAVVFFVDGRESKHLVVVVVIRFLCNETEIMALTFSCQDDSGTDLLIMYYVM